MVGVWTQQLCHNAQAQQKNIQSALDSMHALAILYWLEGLQLASAVSIDRNYS